MHALCICWSTCCLLLNLQKCVVPLFREARKDDWKSRQQAVKQDMLSQKLAAANAQEQAKMAMFRDMIAPGVAMTIPKRQ